MKWDGDDFGTATAVPSRRGSLATPAFAARAVLGKAPPWVGNLNAGRLADLFPYPLVVPLWGVRTRSELNQREHWAARHRRFTAQRAAVGDALRPLDTLLALAGAEVGVGGRLVVTLCRVGPRKLDDDNLAGALKAVRDEVAEWLGVDDGHAGIKWRPEQRRGEDGVIIAIQPVE